MFLSDNAKLAILFQLFMIQITDIETQITDFEVCVFSTHYEQEVFTTIQVNYLIYKY